MPWLIDRGNMGLSMLVVIGLLIVFVGVALAVNLAGSGDFVIRNLTSRSLGTLAPGFAASRTGFKVYANLLSAIGMVIVGLAWLEWSPVFGIVVAALGLVLFLLDSVIVIVGEVWTYRALNR